MGVDVGTTGVKAAVFDTSGAMLGYGFRGYEVLCAPGCAEQDAEEVWRQTAQAVRKAAGQAGGDIAAVSVSAQGDAAIPMGRDRRALCPAQLGMDYRAEAETRELEEAFGGRRLFGVTGMRPHPMNFIVKVMWFRRNRPRVDESVWKYVTYADFILAKLGSDEPAINFTMASRTMALDLETGSWHGGILAAAGVDAALLSRPVRAGCVVGTLSAGLSRELGIEPGAKLVAGGHDQVCAALGAGLVREGLALDSHGTAEVVSTAFDSARLNDAMYAGYYPCTRHAADGMYFTFGLNHTAGLLMKWYLENLGLAEAEEAAALGERPFEQIARRATPDPSPLLVLPYFNGSGTPFCDLRAKGAIAGLTLSSTRHDISKGIMDALAFELRQNLEYLAQADVPVRRLLCVGGGARSPIDLQLKADVTGLPVSTLRIREAACFGAAILAGVGAGAFGSAREAGDLVQTACTFEPQPELHRRYDEKYGTYRKFYAILKEIQPELKGW